MGQRDADPDHAQHLYRWGSPSADSAAAFWKSRTPRPSVSAAGPSRLNIGTTLELAVDFRLANNLAPTDSLTLPNTITITGNGWNTGTTTLGALYSHDGINSVTGDLRSERWGGYRRR